MPLTVNGLAAGEETADKTNRLLHLSFLGGFSVRQGETAVTKPGFKSNIFLPEKSLTSASGLLCRFS